MVVTLGVPRLRARQLALLYSRGALAQSLGRAPGALGVGGRRHWGGGGGDCDADACGCSFCAAAPPVAAAAAAAAPFQKEQACNQHERPFLAALLPKKKFSPRFMPQEQPPNVAPKADGGGGAGAGVSKGSAEFVEVIVGRMGGNSALNKRHMRTMLLGSSLTFKMFEESAPEDWYDILAARLSHAHECTEADIETILEIVSEHVLPSIPLSPSSSNPQPRAEFVSDVFHPSASATASPSAPATAKPKPPRPNQSQGVAAFSPSPVGPSHTHVHAAHTPLPPLHSKTSAAGIAALVVQQDRSLERWLEQLSGCNMAGRHVLSDSRDDLGAFLDDIEGLCIDHAERGRVLDALVALREAASSAHPPPPTATSAPCIESRGHVTPAASTAPAVFTAPAAFTAAPAFSAIQTVSSAAATVALPKFFGASTPSFGANVPPSDGSSASKAIDLAVTQGAAAKSFPFGTGSSAAATVAFPAFGPPSTSASAALFSAPVPAVSVASATSASSATGGNSLFGASSLPSQTSAFASVIGFSFGSSISAFGTGSATSSAPVVGGIC